ncbi:MAG: ABC transporter permease [Nakamurella sp.]
MMRVSDVPWAAVAAIARTELRSGWKLFVSCGLLVGLLAGAALLSAQVAHRTATAYDRLVAAVALDDARLVLPTPTPAEIADLTTFSGVRASSQTIGWVGQVLGHGVNFLDISAPVTPAGVLVQPVIISGRAADPTNPSEIILGEPLAAQTGLAVGDDIELALLTAEEISQFDVGFGAPDGPTVPLRIVGIGRLPAWGNGIANAAGTPAFAAKYGSSAGQLTAFFALAPGQAARTAFAATAAAFIANHPTSLATLGPVRLTYPAAEVDSAVLAGAQFLNAGLLVFGGLLLASALLLLAGVMLRRAADSRSDQQIEGALGMTRSASVLARTAPAAGSALLAGVLCAVIGVAFAALPAAGGLSRFEPTPGFLPNGLLIAGLSVASAAAVLAVCAAAIWLGSRPAESAIAPVRSGRVPARLWPWVEMTAGFRFAGGAMPSRWSLAGRITGIGVGAAAVLAAATFGASLDRTVDSPERWGWSADAVVFDVKPDQLSTLAADPRVADLDLVRNATVDFASAAVSGATPASADATIEGSMDSFTAYGIERRSGELPWRLIEGRLPESAAEVAVGTVLADNHGLAVGSSWQLPAAGSAAQQIGDLTSSYQVVGIVSPLAQLRDALGDSAVFTLAGLAGVNGLNPSDSAYVRAIPGAADALVAELAATTEILTPARPAQIADLADIRLLPAVLAVVLGALTALAMVIVVRGGARRQVSDLATLTVLGLTAGQRRAVLLWSAGAIAVPALAIGIPFGIGLGRLLWGGLAQASGVGGDAIVPAWIAVGFAAAILASSGAAAVLTGRQLAPATLALRSE